MLNKLTAWIIGEVTTIESILSRFMNTVEQLEQHAANQFNRAAEHAAHVIHYNTMAEVAADAESVAKADAQTAVEIAAKIKTLVTV